MNEQILIIDFGSQFTQLIARRVRELNVYCEIHPFNHLPELTSPVKGVILSGSPCSVRDHTAPNPDLTPFLARTPLLGICYGAQLLAHQQGGEVKPSSSREYGRARLSGIAGNNPLLRSISTSTQVWMSHGDTITQLPPGFEPIASTDTVPIAAFRVAGQETYGIQFHPEVTHSSEGKTLLRNFVVNICGCAQNWTPEAFVESTVQTLKNKLGSDKVVMALSGGVDSSVAATLIHEAVEDNLYCIFVDNGLLRKNEYEEVLHSYETLGLNVVGVDAKSRFYAALVGLTDPEAKRKAIGKTFIDVFDVEAHRIRDVRWLGQGTIYPDVIESVSVKGLRPPSNPTTT